MVLALDVAFFGSNTVLVWTAVLPLVQGSLPRETPLERFLFKVVLGIPLFWGSHVFSHPLSYTVIVVEHTL